MANEFKIKKGLIVTGASGGTVVDIQGSQGQLFSVTDDLSGSIFAVSDISGVPILDVNSSGLSTFDGLVSSKDISIKQTDDSGFDGGLTIERSANTQKVHIGMDGGAVNFNSPGGLSYKFRNNGTEKFTLDGSGNGTFVGITTAPTFKTSNLGIVINNQDIYSNEDYTGNDGSIRLNRLGYQGGQTKFRDVVIFDGKGVSVATFDGSSKAITMAGKATSLATAASDGSTTLTTKSYVDGLVTGVPVYKGTWAAGTTGVTSAAINGTTITLTAAPTETIAIGDVVTADGIIAATTVTAVASQTSVTVSATVVIANTITVTFSSEGGYPDLTLAAAKVLGNYYIVSTAGSAAPNGTSVEPDSWAVGDWCIFSDVTPGAGTDLWQRIDNSSVISGAGTGKTIPLWEGETNADSETLTDSPITVSGNNTTFAGNISTVGQVSIADATTYARLNLSGAQANGINYSLYTAIPGVSDSGFAIRRTSGGDSNVLSFDGSNNATFAGTGTFTGGGNTLMLKKGTGNAALTFAGTASDPEASALIEGIAGGGLKFYTSNGGTIGTPAWSSKLTIAAGGNAAFSGTVTAADLLTVNGDGHLFLGADGETPKIDMMYVDSASGAGWDTRIFTGRTDDLPNAQAFPTSTIAGGFGTQYQANSDGAFFGIIPYATGHYRPIINWGDDVADTPFSFQFNGSDIVTINYVGGITAPSFSGDHIGTINTATTGFTQTAGDDSTKIATTAYADAAAAAVPIGNYLPLTAGGTVPLTGELFITNAPGVNVSGAATDQYFLQGKRTGNSGNTFSVYDNNSTAYINSYQSMSFRANQHGGSGGAFGFFGGNVGINETAPAAFLDIQPSASSRKVTRIANDVTSTYFYNTQVDAILAWTCGSYYQAEVVITANQTNGGTTANLYIRGIWSNNHTSHHWDELEHIGSLPGSTFTMSVGQNGSTTNSGRLELDFNYGSGSFSQLNVRVTDFFGSHSYTIT